MNEFALAEIIKKEGEKRGFVKKFSQLGFLAKHMTLGKVLGYDKDSDDEPGQIEDKDG